MPAVVPVPRSAAYPYPTTGIARDAQGVAYYEDLPTSLVTLLRDHADDRPDAEAVVELGGRRLTYRQLWDAAARVAGGLREQGVGRGDRVAVRYPAGVDWTLAFLGTVLCGGIAVAVNTRLAPPEVEFVLADCGAVVDLAPDVALPDGDPVVVDDLGPDDVAAFFYTSGTTGHPKGVPTTHRAFLSNARTMTVSLALSDEPGPDLRTLISVPLFHVTGCNSQLLVALYLGGAAVIMPALDLAGVVDALVTERISFLVTVPAVYALLLRHPRFAAADVSGVRWVGYGGAPIAPSLVLDLKRAFPNSAVSNGYGMTETASLMTVLPDHDAVEHADSVGYAMPVVDLAIAPLDGDPLTGELLARGPNVMTAYWQRAEETAATVVDGWLRTGDIVCADEDGRIHIVDRAKDIINRGGENVSSVEVEGALASAPGVGEAAVLAVPDDVMGEKVGAVLVGVDGADPDVEAVLAHCRERLADYKIPQFVRVVSSPLPRNAGGKLLKSRLRGEADWGPPLR
ncbi:class I adenylate-forming enzyme family protein [uncultured Jatrophihabitans sp.]|uniref:class I adenylate-forming enzyme family protein n=1 Tax=uncultured Jatrophihabitans sp. TaxID=1610747 RepID=UPI0035CA2A5A